MEKIDYFEIPELPGKPLFRCEKRRASLSAEACAGLWTKGNQKGADDRFWLCKGCQVGAQHAGVGDATLSPIYAAALCARCHRGTTRLIGGHLCVSCYNRSREWIKGRNARGNAPVTHPDLFRMSIRYRVGGAVKVLARDDVAAPIELVVAALRDEPKQVTFGMMSPSSPLPQLELFA